MDLEFLPAIELDRAFFIYTHHLAYRSVIEKVFGWDDKLQDGFANKSFDNGGIEIVWHQNKKVGIVQSEDHEHSIFLKEVLLLPEYQGQGIGSEIIKNMMSRARLKNQELRLQVLKENTGAKKLYERHGFIVTDSTDMYWKMSW